MLKSLSLLSGMAVATAVLSFAAHAQTALEEALATGAPLSSNEISEMIVDHTVTARAGERTFIFYYSPENMLTGKMLDGNWSDTGFFGITDDNRICLSMTPDKGRLRCMSLVARDGIVQKFNSAGEMTFELLSFEKGNRL